MKTIVTHISPDVDAASSVWLLHRFLPGWSRARVVFVPAGSTLNGHKPDEDPSIIHVDTGLGMLDHHQTQEMTCAAARTLEWLIGQSVIKPTFVEPLTRMIDVVTEIDHFQEVFWPEPDADYYNYLLTSVVDGLKIKLQDDDKLLDMLELMLDAILQSFFNKVKAEQDIQQGLIFTSKWGKAIAMLTDNEESMRLAQKQGFSLVIRKSPAKGHARIKSVPKKSIDLTPLYKKILAKDSKATWFFHVSRHMILNGSSKNPDSIPTTLDLPSLVGLAK